MQPVSVLHSVSSDEPVSRLEQVIVLGVATQSTKVLPTIPALRLWPVSAIVLTTLLFVEWSSAPASRLRKQTALASPTWSQTGPASTIPMSMSPGFQPFEDLCSSSQLSQIFSAARSTVESLPI